MKKELIQIDRCPVQRFLMIVGMAAARERAKALAANPSRPWNA